MADNRNLTLIDASPCSGASQFFKPTSGSKQLMQHVIHADYAAIEKAWDENIELMFQPVKLKHITISPLQKAFELVDTTTWKRFFDRIKDQPEWVKQFYQQADALKNHINLQPLLDSYTEYDAQYRLWRNHKIDSDAIDEKWFDVAKKQAELLPAHMMKEFCRKGDAWTMGSEFNVDLLTVPKESRVYEYSLGEEIELNSKGSNFGRTAAVVRGQNDCPWLRKGVGDECRDSGEYARAAAAFDGAVLSQLYKKRVEDFAAQMALRDEHLQQVGVKKHL